MKTHRLISPLSVVSSLVVCGLVVLLAGCTYTGKQTPLQPGDAIIFKRDGLRRAQEFRHDSGNDPGLTNRVVNITVPTTVITP
jgi:hypothetical protein